MKFKHLSIVMILLSMQVHAQVSINTDGSQPDPAAILDVKSTGKGVLFPRLSVQQINQIPNPPAGLMVFNTDSGKLVLFDGTNWHEFLMGSCVPMPSTADAGIDQVISSGTSTTLQAAVPSIGTGHWSIIHGVGGVFGDTANPASLFTGQTMSSYTLRWSVTTACGTSEDDVNISFMNVEDAIFVSSHGDDANPGTITAPAKTIQHGIALASSTNKHAIYIAEGVYTETVTLASAIDLFGGFDSLTWIRDPALFVTTIHGGTKAVIGSSVNGVLLDGITIHGANATTLNESSYGVFLTNCTGIEIASCSVVSGNGIAGSSGTSGTAGINGYAGSPGQSGCENSTWPCSSCGAPQIGYGSGSSFGSYGGNGGNAGLGPGYGQAGNSGGGAGGGAGGQAGIWYNSNSCFGYKMPGFLGNGSDGQAGIQGTNGAGGTLVGGIQLTGYVPSDGMTGSSGTAGGGGGGGGGGHGGEVGCDSYGSSGGGGGSGGQQGSPGTGGKGGAGSFAVWCFGSQVTVSNCSILTGNGGTGGSGGTGGTGGTGGMGGACGPWTTDQDDGGCGGYGGNGGSGGRGGHGGGGGGGPSIGIMKDAASTVTQTGNSFTLGSAGSGGTSAGNPGQNGTRTNTNF